MTQHVVRNTVVAPVLGTVLTLFLSACGPGTAGDGQEPVDRTAYPEGPYGTAEGEVIDNHGFETPSGSSLTFQDVRADESHKLLLLSTAAGWCTACRDEQGTLQDLQDTHGADGLLVLVTIFEDNNSQVADLAFVQDWISQYDLTLDVVLDAPFVMSAYYDETLTPMNMFVDLDTMEILRMTTGFDQSVVDAIISSRL